MSGRRRLAPVDGGGCTDGSRECVTSLLGLVMSVWLCGYICLLVFRGWLWVAGSASAAAALLCGAGLCSTARSTVVALLAVSLSV